jgi:hypothetical protein
MPLTLRIDPWDPAYDSALQIEPDEDAPLAVDPNVETSDWSRPIAAAPGPRPGAVVFIDGVQRIETRVIGDDAGRVVFGAFTSLAVGAVVACPGDARINPDDPERVLALSDGARTDPVDVACGHRVLRFNPHSTAASGFTGVREALRSAREAAEAHFGEKIASQGYPLVIVDGPLGFWPARHSSVVGLVKTIHKQYLSGAHAELLLRLGPGERTPIFHIQRDRSAYSWYLRLAQRHHIEHPWAGLVRLEALEFAGRDAAVKLAGLTAAALPAFASSRVRDPRAPQNLHPVGALETHLRRLLGDPQFIRRSIEAHLYREGAAA